jgi:hypothetical protein
MRMLRAVVGTAMALLATVAVAQETLPPTNWQVTATFRPDGTSVCTIRFPAPRGSQSLQLEARTPPKSDKLVAAFIVGGLPPLLAGKRGVMRDLTVSIGSKWAAQGLKADWAKGAGAADSRIVVEAADKVGDVIQPIVNGGPLVIEVPLSNGTHRYSFNLGGAAGPMTAFVDCIRRWSGGEQ